VKILCRTAHVLCAGVLVGAYIFEISPALRSPWLHWTIVSGLLILLVDLHESGVFLFQLRGLIVIGKFGVLAAPALLGELGPWWFAALLAISVLSSHAPGKIRYFVVLWGRRFTGAETKG
jgi:hypothetical protein